MCIVVFVEQEMNTYPVLYTGGGGGGWGHWCSKADKPALTFTVAGDTDRSKKFKKASALTLATVIPIHNTAPIAK